MESMSEETTHFGFKSIPTQKKTEQVASVFRSVAKRYDIMNDLMSLGLHHLWKRLAVAKCQVNPNDYILDLAGGTGDISSLLAKKLKAEGKIFLADINEAMLAKGKDRLLDAGISQAVSFIQTNAEVLPFAAHSFDRIIIGFGLRNVTYKEKALKEMQRVLKPGGRLVILEFSEVSSQPLSKIYNLYSFSVLPKLGEWICQDKESYQYLAESIRMHPNQETLKNMMQEAGFERCEYQNIHAGIVAIHVGYKF